MSVCYCVGKWIHLENSELFAHSGAGCADSVSQTPGVPLDNVAKMFGTWGERLYKHVILLQLIKDDCVETLEKWELGSV